MPEGFYSLLFDQFISTIMELRSKYLSRFLEDRPVYGPEQYGIDVKAFCVFSHSALEYLFEAWAMAYSDYVFDQWKLTKKATAAISALCLYHGKVNPAQYETSKTLPSYWDVFSERVASGITDLQTYIMQRNNGINRSHVRRLFWPLAIDVTRDPVRFESSLARLAKARGSYAHKYDRSDHISPEDAWKIVSDCIDLAGELEIALTYETFGTLGVGRRKALLSCLRRVLLTRQQE